jgi:O-acetylserine/cysteine efflux transporter
VLVARVRRAPVSTSPAPATSPLPKTKKDFVMARAAAQRISPPVEKVGPSGASPGGAVVQIPSAKQPSAFFEASRGQTAAVIAAAATTITLWALTPVTTRFAAGQLDGISIGLVRTIGAGAIAAPLLAVFRMAAPKGRSQWLQIILSAIGSFGLGPVLFSFGTATTSASHSALIMAAMPLFAGVIAAAMERRWPSRLWITGAVIALAGEAALIGLRMNFATTGATLGGDICVLAGCIAWAGGFVAGANVTKEIGPWRATFWALALGSGLLLPLAAVYFPAVNWTGLTYLTWGSLAHISIGASLLAYICWFWAMARGGIARVAVFQFAQPPLALVFAVLLLGERLTVGLIAAACAILAGIVIAQRR